jgi:ppGpp synthetase/RelA/SpoT-type nucleotidyltranferase
MKIPGSIRDVYNNCKIPYEKLGNIVDDIFEGKTDKSWHYDSRIKSIQSFALKVESGRFFDIQQLEDYFACTIVVENHLKIAHAEKLVKKYFDIVERRPQKDSVAKKSHECFPFDDLRLYVKLKTDSTTKPKGVEHLKFEIQIKTFLQHAWSIATHDMIYKSNEQNWGASRIAFQIKAMLEHAEGTISEASKLADNDYFSKSDKKTQDINDTITVLKSLWKRSDLPINMVSLAKNVNSLLSNINKDIKYLEDVLKAERRKGRGPKIINLSPYTIIVQSLINQDADSILKFSQRNSRKFKLLIPKEVEMPTSLNEMPEKNFIMVA